MPLLTSSAKAQEPRRAVASLGLAQRWTGSAASSSMPQRRPRTHVAASSSSFCVCACVTRTSRCPSGRTRWLSGRRALSRLSSTASDGDLWRPCASPWGGCSWLARCQRDSGLSSRGGRASCCNASTSFLASARPPTWWSGPSAGPPTAPGGGPCRPTAAPGEPRHRCCRCRMPRCRNGVRSGLTLGAAAWVGWSSSSPRKALRPPWPPALKQLP
mmetsp:Transcript_38611/g.82104  ORF Transcript_38611/g.82104 Transcript_38611/m.82104 type:complete len:215 (-) Transcript_38611:794-1438(-)